MILFMAGPASSKPAVVFRSLHFVQRCVQYIMNKFFSFYLIRCKLLCANLL